MEGIGLPRNRIAVTVVAAVAIGSAIPADARPLSEELRHLLETNPRILSSKDSADAAQEGIRESRGAFYPSVDINAQAGHDIVDSPGRRSSRGEASETNTDKEGVTLNLNIFDGFRKYANLDRSRFEKEAADLDFEATKQTTLFDGINVYIDVLRQTRLLDIARLSERTIQLQLQLEDERVRRGSGLTVDVLQSKSRLQIAKEVRVGIQGALQQAMTRYVQIFGRPPDTVTMADPQPPLGVLPDTPDAAVVTAREENPALASSFRQIDVAQQNLRAARSEYFPSLDFVVEGNREQDLDGISGLKRELLVQLKARWQLFDGFAREARVARAAKEKASSQNNHVFTDRQIVESVGLAWSQLETARERKELLENAITIAEEVFEARKKLRAAGKETVINVLDAENEVNNARLQFTSAFYDEMRAVYQLLGAMGRLTPDTLGLQN